MPTARCQDAIIRYSAFADYWAGKQPVDALIFAITTDPAVGLQKLRAGECNSAVSPAPADIPQLKTDQNIKGFTETRPECRLPRL